MPKLSKQEVENIAHLARIKLTEEEYDFYESELSNVIDYVGQLNKADVSKVEATAHVSGLDTVAREDKERTALDMPQELAGKLMVAVSLKYKGFVKVKAIFSKK